MATKLQEENTRRMYDIFTVAPQNICFLKLSTDKTFSQKTFVAIARNFTDDDTECRTSNQTNENEKNVNCLL